LVEYISNSTNTTISFDNSAKSKFKQPLLAGFGLLYRISSKLRLASDISWVNWENYEVEYFGEQRSRNFKNIVKGGIGVEYRRELSDGGQHRSPTYA
jgi:long-subunit fatty acid transport protein